jgi:hypothetical protein
MAAEDQDDYNEEIPLISRLQSAHASLIFLVLKGPFWPFALGSTLNTLWKTHKVLRQLDTPNFFDKSELPWPSRRAAM